MSVPQPGYQKLVAINGYPIYLDTPFDVFPRQEVKAQPYIQGGPRTAIYVIGEKIVKGSLKTSIYLAPGEDDIDNAIKELLLSAQNPLRPEGLRIDTNYVLSNPNITDDPYRKDFSEPNQEFGSAERLSFHNCGVTELKISVPNEGVVSVEASFVGMVHSDQAASVPDPVDVGMMRRAITYADCKVFLKDPAYEWDTARNFNIKVENKIEPIYALLSAPVWLLTDQPRALTMQESTITGEITYSVKKGTLESERLSLPPGGYAGRGLTFDLAGMILAEFPYCILGVTEQPVGFSLLERKSKWLAVFQSAELDNSGKGHFLTLVE